MAEASHAVFLSYASQGAQVALNICEALRPACIEVWFDQSALRQAVRLALATAAASAAPLALAQTAPAGQAAPALEEVVVTGSRLLQPPNEISISPITSVTEEDIQKTGLVRTEDILGMLPQVVAEQNSGTNISSVGVATVSLRDLGSQRTLVLVNNRRMNPGGAGGISGGNANAADLNQIPAALIERVDVLTGGASAVYGADAMAGVINFVLNTHYQGVKVDVSYGWNNHSNDSSYYKNLLTANQDPIPPGTVNTGQNRDISFLAGSNFSDGKGNATVYATFLNSSPAVGYQFDHSACTLTGGATANSAIHCGGSGTSAHGQWLMLGLKGGVTTTVANTTINQSGGGMIPYVDARDAYNYGALSYFQRGADRYTAGAFFHYDINPHATVYSETMWSRNTSTAQYGPSGSFFQPVTLGCPGAPGAINGGNGVTGNVDPYIAQTPNAAASLCTPALIAANQAVFGTTGNQIDVYLARRSVESGGRLDNYASNAIRQVAGVKGRIDDVWSYDAYGQFGITQLQDQEGGYFAIPQITSALEAVTGPNGRPVCADPHAIAAGCVPWDVWAPANSGAVTPQQLAYLGTPAGWVSYATEYIGDGEVTGDLGKLGAKLPSAESGLSLLVGTQYRSERFNFQPDFVFLSGLQAGGAPALPIDNGFHLWEGYMEARLPLIDHGPGLYRLSFEAGYRYSSYTLGFNTNTYKFGLEWTPIQDVRVRGGYNRAVRAPNLDELYTEPSVGAGGTADPCWGSAPVLTPQECLRTGVPLNRYGHLSVNSAAQINTLTAGLSTLKPEFADTYTFGLVFQPQAINNLVVTLDYFDINISNTITSLSPTTIIYNCGLGADPQSCSRIHRNPNNQSLWLGPTEFVDVTEENVGKIKTSGVDAVGHYRVNVGKGGKLGFNLVGTYVHEFILQTAPSSISGYDCVGHFGVNCEAPLPSWRHIVSADWGTPWAGLDVTVRWRYIGSTSTDRSSSQPLLASAFYTPTAHIPAYSYLDLTAAIPIGNSVDFRIGVNNIADKNPPLILSGELADCANTCNNNTWVGTYDTLGRYIYMHVGVKF